MPKIADVCRFCGSEGEIDPELDPCPHVCPRCMNQRMFALLVASQVEPRLDPASQRAWMAEKLKEIGFKTEYATLLADGNFEAIQRRAEQAVLTSIARYGVESPS